MATPLASSPHAKQDLIAHLTAAYNLLEPFHEAVLDVDLNDQIDISNWLCGIDALLEGISKNLLHNTGYIVLGEQHEDEYDDEDFIPF